jgi:hypothetical protein
MMRVLIFSLVLIFTIYSEAYALNFLEKLAYREVLLKSYNQRVLVTRLTGQVKFIWCAPTPVMVYGNRPADGNWMPPRDEKVRKMWQNIYDHEK